MNSLQRKQRFKLAVKNNELDFLYSRIANYINNFFLEYNQKPSESREQVNMIALEEYYNKSNIHKQAIMLLHQAACTVDYYQDVKRYIDKFLQDHTAKVFEEEALVEREL